jgi:cob(I)alamin adenosyltransferase
MKIYTKTGDGGETSLAIGGRVKKYDPRVSLYGTSDELNSVIGLAISFLPSQSGLSGQMSQVQSLLFELGSELAGYFKKSDTGEDIPIILDSDISMLEQWMDEWSEKLEPLKHFVLPGGCHAASFFHQARTVCRRLERSMVEERDNGLPIANRSIIFINRLSDALFLAARISNKEENFSEPIWESRAKKS